MMLSFSTKFTAFIVAIALSTPIAATVRRGRKVRTEQLDDTAFISSDREQLDRDLQTRIVGGIQTQLGKYPYYTQWVWGCGAVLIHDDIVLTAAHCNKIISNHVIVGAYQDSTTGNGAVSANITQRVLHPRYTQDSQANDFLILKLSSPVPNTPVNLNRDTKNPSTGETLVVVGLGTLAYGGPTSAFLREVEVQAIDHTTCNTQYGGKVDQASMLCAGVSGGGKDSCQGDSGGPLVEIVNGVHTLVGLVSWGSGCAEANYPGVYSRVSFPISWIDQQICALSVNPPASCGSATPKPTSAKPTNKRTAKPTAMPTAKPTVKPTVTSDTTNSTVAPAVASTSKRTKVRVSRASTPTKSPTK